MMTMNSLSTPALSMSVGAQIHKTSRAKFSPTPMSPAQPLHEDFSQNRWFEAMTLSGLASLMSRSTSVHLLIPSDAAFESLLQDLQLGWAEFCGDLPRLRALMLGHVLMDGQNPAWASPGSLIRTANGQALKLEARGVLRDAQGTSARLLRAMPTSAGPKAHGIDRVLRPAEQSLLDLLGQDPEFSLFNAALQTSGLQHWLAGKGPFTLLAPCNAGWSLIERQLGLSTESLLSGPSELLRHLVGRHLVVGKWLSDELPWGSCLIASNGDAVNLSALGLIGEGPLAQALPQDCDQQASNGVLHRLGHPLLSHH